MESWTLSFFLPFLDHLLRGVLQGEELLAIERTAAVLPSSEQPHLGVFTRSMARSPVFQDGAVRTAQGESRASRDL